MPETEAARPRRSTPLYARVLLGVLAGTALGVAFGTRPYLLGYGNEDLGAVGMLVIRLLKALATPLILFAILDSFLRTLITARTAFKFLLICCVNVSVAMTIGLLILNLAQPGIAWRGRLEGLGAALGATAPDAAKPLAAPASPASLDPLKNLAGYVPESVLDPLLKNNVIPLVLLAVLAGAALRRVKDAPGENAAGMQVVEGAIGVVYRALSQMLLWVAEVVPFGVAAIVAQVVGRSGVGVFSVLAVFLATMLAGLLLHGLLYYPAAAWIAGGRSPREFLGKGADAIVTGLSINSSLATVPVTLRCLSRMGVSPASARMSACIGTNLNNDGITLYEAMATLFLAQALGFDLSLAQQITVVLASILVGVGIAGIPDAGLIVLPLVLAAAGFDEATVAAAIPLIVPVDWIIARARSGVNVMGDMLVAILLDRGQPPTLDEAVLAVDGACADAGAAKD